MLWRRINRWVSSAWYSGLFLIPRREFERRHVARRLVDAAKQNRDVLELHAGTPLDPWNGYFRQISVRAAEIELEFNLQGHVSSSRERIG